MTDENPYSPSVADPADRRSPSSLPDEERKTFRWQILPAFLSVLLGLFYCLLIFLSFERLPDLFRDWDNYSAPWASLITSSILGLMSTVAAIALFVAARSWIRNQLRIAMVLLTLGIVGYLAIPRFGKWDAVHDPVNQITVYLGLDPDRG